MGEVTPAEFSWAFTPATPQTGLVDFLNLTVKDGRLRVIARQGNEGLNGKRVQFDLPIEAFHDLREAMSAARPGDDDVVIGEFVARWDNAADGVMMDADTAQQLARAFKELSARPDGKAIMDEIDKDPEIPTDTAVRVYAAIKRAAITALSRGGE